VKRAGLMLVRLAEHPAVRAQQTIEQLLGDGKKELQLGRRAERLGRNLQGMNTAQRSAIQRHPQSRASVAKVSRACSSITSNR
jgi:hypothetical protein